MRDPEQYLRSISGPNLSPTSAAFAFAVVLLIPAIVGAQSVPRPASYDFRVIYDFCSLPNCADGGNPRAGLISGPGFVASSPFMLYGAAGPIFRLTPSGKETVLGGEANVDLIRDPAGNFYGTTQYGGDLSCDAPYGCGTVFKLDPAGTETVLYSFKGAPDGMQPWAGLIRDSAGNLYGTTNQGGDLNCGFQFGCGTVFKLDAKSNETILHSFTFYADSGFPEGGLVMDSAGNLYGTTFGDGTDFPGTVFKISPNGTETVLYTFENGSDGENPMGSLVMDAEGSLYGTTTGVGYPYWGTVFKLTKTGQETVLWDFHGPPDGGHPEAGLVMDAQGNLYGTTYLGGDDFHQNCVNNGCGTVFEVTKSGSESVLYSFTGESDGGFPTGRLLLDAKGNLYGMTPWYGYSQYVDCFSGAACGVVFELTRQ